MVQRRQPLLQARARSGLNRNYPVAWDRGLGFLKFLAACRVPHTCVLRVRVLTLLFVRYPILRPEVLLVQFPFLCPFNAYAVLYLYSEVLMLAIRLPQSIEKRLEKLARRTGRTKTFYVREAILEHLDDLEDLYQAERILERIRSGEEPTVPLEDVLKRHGLED
jgi:RHH-type transcriptional regulator, rel operon repressor / antitoxin RelB